MGINLICLNQKDYNIEQHNVIIAYLMYPFWNYENLSKPNILYMIFKGFEALFNMG